jgi:uncharacterized membrane protein
VEVAVYTAVTFVATVLLVVETPATGGYFNLGEAAIYSIAFVSSSPLVAGLASGLGPAVADVVLGYGYFAPATLVIKFAEGYVVSRLARGGYGRRLGAAAFALALGLAAVVAAFLGGQGGGASVSVYWTPTRILGVEIPVPTVSLQLPSYAWYAVAALVLLVGAAAVLEGGRRLLPMILGGLIMVTGYFLYEFFVSNPLILGRNPWGAVFEVPVNVGQAAAGMLLAYPVVRFVARAKPGVPQRRG